MLTLSNVGADDKDVLKQIDTSENMLPMAIFLPIARKLTIDETKDLLNCAGYSISHSQKFDMIIECFIINGQFAFLK